MSLVEQMKRCRDLAMRVHDSFDADEEISSADSDELAVAVLSLLEELEKEG